MQLLCIRFCGVRSTDDCICSLVVSFALGDSEGYWGPPTIGSAAARERGRSVKVEFVYADGGEREVCLCGSWNEWSPTQMHKEGGTYL